MATANFTTQPPMLNLDQVGQVPAESSSISVGTVAEPAMLGISRIWTSNLFRKHGIATKLLEVARSQFLYGMTIKKEQVAFSQPTESGGRLAKKWFGQREGWHVYTG
jgi:N-acetyltransferase